jgi:serine/threonine protein phosphatase 1
MQRHYVIGDVHGEYEMLLALVEKLPPHARLIFVGDLVNRGKKSKEVIDFVRNHAYRVVKGNHEGYMQAQGEQFLSMLESYKNELSIPYQYIGGSPILQPYQLLTRMHDQPHVYKLNQEGLSQLKEDLAWIESLPLIIELGRMPNYHLPIVISHGNLGDYWYLKDENPRDFEFYAIGNRLTPSNESPIFNIYGHIAVNSVAIGKNFVCVDTGCGKHPEAKLSAYCIETKEVVDISRKEKILI